MSFAARDGKKFGNRQRQQKYDSMHSAPPSKGAPSDAVEAADDQSVAAQHGPASSIQITSQHPDGHIQKSVHQSADDACKHAAQQIRFFFRTLTVHRDSPI